jgi:hypothetical protein
VALSSAFKMVARQCPERYFWSRPQISLKASLGTRMIQTNEIQRKQCISTASSNGIVCQNLARRGRFRKLEWRRKSLQQIHHWTTPEWIYSEADNWLATSPNLRPDDNHDLGRNSGPKYQQKHVGVYVRVCMQRKVLVAWSGYVALLNTLLEIPWWTIPQLKYFISYSCTWAAYWNFSHESMVKYTSCFYNVQWNKRRET